MMSVVTGVANLRLWAALVLFTAATVAGNEIGSTLRYPSVGAAVFFPPYAALTAALVVAPRRHWGWYIAVAWVAHFVAHWPQWQLSWVLLADVANVARALVAAILLTALFGSRPRLDTLRALLFFFIVAVLIAPAVGAAIGAANVILHGAASTYWEPWRAWFVSNALTGLTMLPGFLALFAWLATPSWYRPSRARVVEALLLVVALAVTCQLAFLGGLWRELGALPLYGSLPALMWAAVRFGPSGASVALTVLTFAAVWSVDRGTGPFLAVPPDENILALQVFILCTAVPVLCLAALAGARESVVQLHRALLASLDDHVAVLDAGGIVLQANPSWRRAAERPDAPSWDRARVGDDYLRACLPSEDPAASSVRDGVRSVLGGGSRRFEIEYDHRQQGVLESFAMTVERLERSEGGAVVIKRNITARRQAQTQIDEQRNQLSHLARVSTLGHLSGAFAHELHQPLSAILGNAEVARKLIRRTPPDLKSLATIVDDIIGADRRAAAVIDRLSVLLKRGEVRFQEVEIKEVIDEVLLLAKTELLTRRVGARALVDPTLPPVWGDKIQLQQVLLNLVLNSCEAMAPIARARSRSLVISAAHHNGNSVHIAVRDSGTGIAPALLGELFKPFVTTKRDGLGLGLSISHTIVAAHGGRLWAENNTDMGATIHCVIPAKAHVDARVDEVSAANQTV
jgi:two-component system, LuxR family, sensor kinase FixL